MKADVLVIGGGIAGLACGAELASSGQRVTVLESEAECGGRARSWTDSLTGDVVDIGPHILLSEYRNMLNLLGDLGTAGDILWQEDKFLTLVGDPHPVDIHMRRLPAPLHFMPSLFSLPQLSFGDLASNRYLIWKVMRLSERDMTLLDAGDAEAYLRQTGVSEHAIDWFWRTACMTIMNVPLEKCSAGAFLRFFRFMIGKSGYQPGFATTGLGELFVPGCIARIEAAGGRVLTNRPAATLLAEGGELRGARLAEGGKVEADFCVAALPPRELLDLLPPEWLAQPGRRRDFFAPLADFQPSSYVCSYLWFDRKLTRERFWARTWSPDNLNYDSYDLSNIRRGWEERPSVIASNLMYSQRIGDMDDETLLHRTLEELAEFLPAVREATLRHWRLHRIPMGIPAPYPGTERLQPPNQTPVPNLLLAGDWTRTGLPSSLESAVCSANRAAEFILAALDRPREIALPPPQMEGLARFVNGI